MDDLEQYATEAAPCGCRFGRGPYGQFIFIPHALDCDVYAFVQAETARQGKPTETRRTS